MAWLESILKDSKKAGRLLALVMVVGIAGYLSIDANPNAESWRLLAASTIGFYLSSVTAKAKDEL